MNKHIVIALAGMSLLGACTDFEGGLGQGYPPDKSIDRGINSHDLSTTQWGIWVNPDGCDHWIADDGVEGYLVTRLDRYGKPVCSGVAPPTNTAGDFKGGSPIKDPN